MQSAQKTNFENTAEPIVEGEDHQECTESAIFNSGIHEGEF